ncbi:hypothetical protein DFH07DRAFT_937875 [Mycena maculata]|uniref:Uncharacterized protein n=1 Tax=Mycena maculata TaxID=230809 RepID=A0AAD7JWP0_9AGAR|nr:hypothetical protein DFH07DRAFT_937875 [Mycena maculata]
MAIRTGTMITNQNRYTREYCLELTQDTNGSQLCIAQDSLQNQTIMRTTICHERQTHIKRRYTASHYNRRDEGIERRRRRLNYSLKKDVNSSPNAGPVLTARDSIPANESYPRPADAAGDLCFGAGVDCESATSWTLNDLLKFVDAGLILSSLRGAMARLLIETRNKLDCSCQACFLARPREPGSPNNALIWSGYEDSSVQHDGQTCLFQPELQKTDEEVRFAALYGPPIIGYWPPRRRCGRFQVLAPVEVASSTGMLHSRGVSPATIFNIALGIPPIYVMVTSLDQQPLANGERGNIYPALFE